MGRAFSARRWKNFILRKIRKVQEPSAQAGNLADINIRDWPEHTKMRARFSTLLQRGVRVLAVYTAGQEYYNYLGQLADSIGSSPNLKELYFPDAGHTYSIPSHRDRMIQALVDWMEDDLV